MATLILVANDFNPELSRLSTKLLTQFHHASSVDVLGTSKPRPPHYFGA